ncbi:50S ribosomal protein L10 [Candidatus Tiddalikarchaeum anstoanum]|nr:50S ribosomal protein L10 [Candidatus Tiddalikarchaeum anstoanum]
MTEKKESVHVKESKKAKVKELVELIKKYGVIGLLNLEKMPSSQLQSIRSSIRKDIRILSVKKSLLTRAFEALGYKDLDEKVSGSPALLLTNLNPFKVYKLIDKNKSKLPIKTGQIAPYDLIISQGDTPFTPGPIIGELGAIGVKAKVDKGKIVIIKDSVVAKKGEPVTGPVSSMLLKLGVKPVEISLNINVIKEGKTIYTKDILSTDFEGLIGVGFNNAKNLVLNTGIFEPSLINEILQKAHLNALMLNGFVHPDQAIKVAAPVITEQKKEKKEDKEEVKEEKSKVDAVEALGALFG